MPSKTSCLNKAFLQHDFRKYSWVAVVYTLALFFAVPLKMIMLQGNRHIVDKSIYKSIFLLQGQQWQYLLIWAVPVGLAILLFRYLHVKTAADTLHSLPVKRSAIYRSHILAGLVLLVVPVLITGLITIILNPLLNPGDFYGPLDVLRWMGLTTLFNWTIFLACVFVGLLVGISTLQGVLTYIMLLFPAGITALVSYNLQLLVYGFQFDPGQQLNKLSPLIRITEGFNPQHAQSMGSSEVLIYLALGLVFYLLADYLYRIRNLEAAGQSIAFPQIHSIFKYGVTFCSMLLGGAYFFATQQTMGWTIFGYVAGSLAGYIIALTVLQKSLGFFKEAKSYYGFAAFGAAIMILLLAVNFDLVGYEKRQPDLEKVQEIYFSNGFYGYNRGTAFFSDPDNLQQIHAMHQSIMANKKPSWRTDNFNQTQSAVFVYHLKNGRTMTRGYQITEADYADHLKPIYESREYKEMYFNILQAQPADVDKITLWPEMRTGDYKEAVILDPGEIKEAVEIMQQDVMRATYEQMTGQREPWARISLLIADDKQGNYPKMLEPMAETRPLGPNGEPEAMHINHAWQKYDELLEDWLQEKGYLAKARILPEQISYAMVEKITSREQWDEMRRAGDWDNQRGEKIQRFKITDKNQIENCLREYRSQWLLDKFLSPGVPDATDNQIYLIRFYGQDQEHLQTGSFIGDQVPDFIKDYFTEHQMATQARFGAVAMS